MDDRGLKRRKSKNKGASFVTENAVVTEDPLKDLRYVWPRSSKWLANESTLTSERSSRTVDIS